MPEMQLTSTVIEREREAERISTTPWRVMHGNKKGTFSDFAHSDAGLVHLNSERREKCKHTQQAVEVINLGFKPNMTTRRVAQWSHRSALVPKVLGSNPAFSTKHVTCLVMVVE